MIENNKQRRRGGERNTHESAYVDKKPPVGVTSLENCFFFNKILPKIKLF